MYNKKIVEKNIKEILSKIPNIWHFDKKSNIQNYLDSIFSFLEKVKKNNPEISFSPNLKPEQIPYNSSIFHFLLYYTYSPKYPFIISRKNTLIFGAFTGRKFNKIEISFPLTKNASNSLKNLNWFLSFKPFNSILEKNKIEKILIRDIDDEFVNLLKNDGMYKLNLESLKELNYAIYNLDKTLKLKGKEYSNLRWHLNKFEKKGFNIEVIPLSDCVKPVIHLIGKWRKKAIENRGFSYVNVRSDKLGARLFKNIRGCDDFKEIVGTENILSRVLKINGKISAFNLGFPLGIFEKQDVFSHSIGISDTSIPHLAEYAQYNFWKEIKDKGYSLVNDGPTWKDDLEIYKNKFRPIGKKRYYWADVTVKL